MFLLVPAQPGCPGQSPESRKEWCGARMVICLVQGADLHMAQLMPLPLIISCFSKIQIVLPFWYELTQVIPDKVQMAIKWMYICMYACI